MRFPNADLRSWPSEQRIKARGVGKAVVFDGAPDGRRYRGVLVVGEVNCRHGSGLRLLALRLFSWALWPQGTGDLGPKNLPAGANHSIAGRATMRDHSHTLSIESEPSGRARPGFASADRVDRGPQVTLALSPPPPAAI
jgi:hypothetical protein